MNVLILKHDYVFAFQDHHLSRQGNIQKPWIQSFISIPELKDILIHSLSNKIIFTQLLCKIF